MNRILQSGLLALGLSQLTVRADTIIPALLPNGITVATGKGNFLGGQLGPVVTPGPIIGGPDNMPAGNAGGIVTMPVGNWDNTPGVTYESVTHAFRFDSTIFPPAFVFGGLGSLSLNLSKPEVYGPFLPALEAPPANLLRLQTVPEPSTFALAALGLGGLLFAGRRK